MNALSFLCSAALALLQSPTASPIHRCSLALGSTRLADPRLRSRALEASAPRRGNPARTARVIRGQDSTKTTAKKMKSKTRMTAAGSFRRPVTNRMMRRMGVSIGISLFVVLLFFPFFYYLKAVAKLDVPAWVLALVFFFFFGASLLGSATGSSPSVGIRSGRALCWAGPKPSATGLSSGSRYAAAAALKGNS